MSNAARNTRSRNPLGWSEFGPCTAFASRWNAVRHFYLDAALFKAKLASINSILFWATDPPFKSL